MGVSCKLLVISMTVIVFGLFGCGSNDIQQENSSSVVGRVAPQFDVITDAQYEQLRVSLLHNIGVLTQKWGNNDAANVTSCNINPSVNGLHQGVDFGAPIGTDVFSPISGVVVTINRGNPLDTSVLSTLVIFNGQSQTSFVFLHMDTIDSTLLVGSSVVSGQHLGTVGARGRVTGPHIHFEARSGLRHAGALCIDGTINPFDALINAR